MVKYYIPFEIIAFVQGIKFPVKDIVDIENKNTQTVSRIKNKLIRAHTMW